MSEQRFSPMGNVSSAGFGPQFVRVILACVMITSCGVWCGGCTAPAKDSGVEATQPAAITTPAADAHPNVPISNTDECAERLHDICGALLSYYRTNLDLPPNLEALKQVPGFGFLDLTCPVTKRPYVYNPVGVQNAQNKQRILIHDPAPVHSGMRWAIVINEPQPDRALVTKVVALPESNFTLQIK